MLGMKDCNFLNEKLPPVHLDMFIDEFKSRIRTIVTEKPMKTSSKLMLNIVQINNELLLCDVRPWPAAASNQTPTRQHIISMQNQARAKPFSHEEQCYTFSWKFIIINHSVQFVRPSFRLWMIEWTMKRKPLFACALVLIVAWSSSTHFLSKSLQPTPFYSSNTR